MNIPNKRYKGIIFDIDGTAVPLGHIKASKRLQEAINAASKNNIKVAAASGRSFGYAQPIFKSLGLTNPSIMMGGSAIIDPLSDKVIWSKAIDREQLPALIQLIGKYKADFWFGISPVKNSVKQMPDITKLPIYTIWASEMEVQAALDLVEAVATIPNTVVHNSLSWKPGLMDAHITHREATKEHATQVLIDMLGLSSDEVIGVGDSSNDIPIFQAVGHRIAMENGTEDLKSLADELAPSVDEDGLAQIIEKYIA